MDIGAALFMMWIAVIWTLNVHNARLEAQGRLKDSPCCIVEKENSSGKR